MKTTRLIGISVSIAAIVACVVVGITAYASGYQRGRGAVATSTLRLTNTANTQATNTSTPEPVYPSHAACFSGFPIVGYNAEQPVAVTVLAKLTADTSSSFMLPDAFLKAMQAKEDGGWSVTTYCVDNLNLGNPYIYFAMSYRGKTSLVTRMHAPATATLGLPSLVGYWYGDRNATSYQPIVFSEPIGLSGGGDIALFDDLRLTKQTTKAGNTVVTVQARTGGGDGPFGWGLDISFDPAAETTQVDRYCTYDSISGVTKTTCDTKLF